MCFWGNWIQNDQNLRRGAVLIQTFVICIFTGQRFHEMTKSVEEREREREKVKAKREQGFPSVRRQPPRKHSLPVATNRCSTLVYTTEIATRESREGDKCYSASLPRGKFNEEQKACWFALLRAAYHLYRYSWRALARREGWGRAKFLSPAPSNFPHFRFASLDLRIRETQPVLCALPILRFQLMFVSLSPFISHSLSCRSLVSFGTPASNTHDWLLPGPASHGR